MALLQCQCSFCEHVYYRVTTPCEWTESGVYPDMPCPACSNMLIERTNLTPDAPLACPGCSSGCEPKSSAGGGGCSGCSAKGGCGLKAALQT